MLGVAQLGGYRINRLRAADEVKNIAELQAGMAAGDQLNPGAIESRDHHVIALFKVQIAYAFTQYFFVSDHHALDFQIGTARGERSGNLLANHQLGIV